MTKPGSWLWRSVFAAFAAASVICAASSFGISRGDAVKLRDFDAAVLRWQSDPDFRAVTREYVTLGVRAMQTRFCGVPARIVILKFRSLPGLPATLAVNSTSAAHYRDFSRGELAAYLHLCDEQGIDDAIPMVERLLNSPTPATDAQIVDFLRSFKMPVPIATDAGAVRSVRAMLDDVAATPADFSVRTRFAQTLRDPVMHLARSLGISASIEEMSPSEQATVLAQLDGSLRTQNREVWRSKQVSDLLAGIWAQGYGQIYRDGIGWLFRIQRMARAGLVAVLVAGVILWKVRDNRRRAAISCKAHGSAVGSSASGVPDVAPDSNRSVSNSAGP